MTSRKRSAQRPVKEFVFLSHSLLQGIKKKKLNRVSCDADEITIYSKQESCSLPFLCFTGCRMGGRRAGCGNPERRFHAALSVEAELFFFI